MKTIIAGLAMLLISTAAQAHGPSLPLTQGKSFEFIEQTQMGYKFHRPKIFGGEQVVLASFYGHGEKLNKYTSSGQVFNPKGYTAAHRTLPLGTKLAVEYKGRRIVVVVNDRGPAKYTGRSLDLSYGAAHSLGMDKAGVGLVRIAVL